MLNIMQTDDLIFISYAREDRSWAEKIYMDMRKAELNAWLDVKCLRAGANWRHEIQKTIRSARYFLLLISKHSVNKRGFIQKEIKEGLKTLEEFPTGSIYIIPARLDQTEPVDLQLHELNWVQLLPDYHDGIARIMSVFADLKREPLKFSGSETPSVPVTFIDKGEPVAVDLPLLLGERAPVSYTPFRTAKEFLQQFFDRLPSERQFADTSVSFYITLATTHERVALNPDIKSRFPHQITLVLQNVFEQLTVRQEGVSVVLTFGGKKQIVAIPYDAILSISMPELGITISLHQGAAT